MTTQTTNRRWIVTLWLILSQLGSILLLIGPWVAAFGLTALMMAGGSLSVIYVCAFPILPVLLIITSWILYARRLDKAAAVTSGILLLLSTAAFFVFLYVTSNVSA